MTVIQLLHRPGTFDGDRQEESTNNKEENILRPNNLEQKWINYRTSNSRHLCEKKPEGETVKIH